MKKWNTVLSRRTAGLFLVVVWFLGLLLVNNGALAQEYTEVYSDTFSEDTLPTFWTTSGAGTFSRIWSITGGKLKANEKTYALLYLRYNGSLSQLRDGKIEFLYELPTANRLIGAIARYGEEREYSYATWIWTRNTDKSNVMLKIVKQKKGENFATQGTFIDLAVLGDVSLSGIDVVKGEFFVTSVEPNKTNLTFVLYDSLNPTVPLATLEAIDTTVYDSSVNNLHLAGQWGLARRIGDAAVFDDVIFSQRDDTNVSHLSLLSDIENVKTGTPVTISVIGDKDTVVHLSDTTNGEFSVSDVSLNENNNYREEVSYTPTAAGSAIITATTDTNETKEITIDVRPYATKIGFIGDSITAGAGSAWYNGVWYTITNLGKGFSDINRGAGGASTQSRINNTCPQWPANCTAEATGAFLSAGVDIISIMLGTNETEPANEYKANMQTIIDTLQNEGFKHIILNQIPYKPWSPSQLPLIQEYNAVLVELVDENAGFVLLGDTLAFTEMETISGLNVGFFDGTHPNSTWYAMLGKLRANAIRSALEYQINPKAEFTGISEHSLWTTEALIFRVDKYFGEFNDVVKVDGVQLAASNYEATSGSTTIELNADYLNTLIAGDHTLTVGFEGGVWVAENFTILPDSTPVIPPTTPTVPTTPSYVGGGGGGISLVKDSCPNGDFSPSYYDKTCWTTANLAEEVTKKVNILRPIIKLIYLTATEEQKTFVHNLITSCSETNKNEVIKLACQELVKDWEF